MVERFVHFFNFLHDEILADRHVVGLSPVAKHHHAILAARSIQSLAAQPRTVVDVPNPSGTGDDELQVRTFYGPKKSEWFRSWRSRYLVAITMDALTTSRAMTASMKITLGSLHGSSNPCNVSHGTLERESFEWTLWAHWFYSAFLK